MPMRSLAPLARCAARAAWVGALGRVSGRMLRILGKPTRPDCSGVGRGARRLQLHQASSHKHGVQVTEVVDVVERVRVENHHVGEVAGQYRA